MGRSTGCVTVTGNPETDALIFGARWRGVGGGVLSHSLAGRAVCGMLPTTTASVLNRVTVSRFFSASNTHRSVMPS